MGKNKKKNWINFNPENQLNVKINGLKNLKGITSHPVIIFVWIYISSYDFITHFS